MDFKFAVIADTHLPETGGTPQYASFNWAISDINEKMPDFVVVAGDLTAAGDIPAFEEFKKGTDMLKVPCYTVIGNADLRTPQNIDYAKKLRTGYLIDDFSRRIVLLDTSSGEITDSDRELLNKSGDNDIIIMHHSVEGLKEESREFLKNWANNRAGVIIHAHSHRNKNYFIGKTEVIGIRCLDPDKSVVKEPCLTYFTANEKEISMHEEIFDFPCDNLKDFRENIGISCFDIYNDIDFAMENNIKNIEIRKFDGSDDELEFLKKKVGEWRAWGGKNVSVHMTNLKWNGESVDGLDMWEKSVRIAKTVGAETVTIHPPRYVRIGDMVKGSKMWNYFVDYFYERIAELPKEINAGIENIHSSIREKDDDDRFFGYTPKENIEFVDALNEKFGFNRVGTVFDVGHARNNGPHGMRNTIGVWEKMIGKRTTAYHIHQIINVDDIMRNHNAIENWAGGPYICYQTFLWSWQADLVNHKPMFMEMKNKENCKITVDSLEKYLKERFNL